MKKMIAPIICVVLMWLYIAVFLPSSAGFSFFGSIVLLILLPLVIVVLVRKGLKETAKVPETTEVFENPRRRRFNRRFGLTTFSVRNTDGTVQIVTVRNGTMRYQELLALRKVK